MSTFHQMLPECPLFWVLGMRPHESSTIYSCTTNITVPNWPPESPLAPNSTPPPGSPSRRLPVSIRPGEYPPLLLDCLNSPPAGCPAFTSCVSSLFPGQQSEHSFLRVNKIMALCSAPTNDAHRAKLKPLQRTRPLGAHFLPLSACSHHTDTALAPGSLWSIPPRPPLFLQVRPAASLSVWGLLGKAFPDRRALPPHHAPSFPPEQVCPPDIPYFYLLGCCLSPSATVELLEAGILLLAAGTRS